MKKYILILLGFLALILALGLISIWQAPDLSNPRSLESFLPQLQKISSLGKDSIAEDQLQEFISPDEKFSITYPSYWLALKEAVFLQALSPQEWVGNYKLEALFLAQNFHEGKFAQLVVYKGVFGIPIGEIFEKMKKFNENNGWTVETIRLETEKNEGIFEGKYANSAGTSLHSKEKIFTSGKEGYLISAFALEKDWLGIEADIDKILNSATIIETGGGE